MATPQTPTSPHDEVSQGVREILRNAHYEHLANTDGIREDLEVLPLERGE